MAGREKCVSKGKAGVLYILKHWEGKQMWHGLRAADDLQPDLWAAQGLCFGPPTVTGPWAAAPVCPMVKTALIVWQNKSNCVTLLGRTRWLTLNLTVFYLSTLPLAHYFTI